MPAKTSKATLLRWQAFATAWIKDGRFNATQAYLEAGYKSGNPDAHGPRLLAHPEVQKLIRGAMQQSARKLNLTADKLLQDLEVLKVGAAKADQFSAAIKACELQARYLNIFPQQYGSLETDPLPGADPDANSADPTSIQDVARGLAFVLAQALRAPKAEPKPAAPAAKPVLN